MKDNDYTRILIHANRAKGIARRYFVTNGFEGALTMLGLMVAFASRENVDISMAITACLGAAIALFMSGTSSAYLSEVAERKKELKELEQSLITDLSESDYGKASRYMPVMVALVNGLSPLLIALIIISPLWLSQMGLVMPFSPFIVAIIVAMLIIFLLGVMLGKVSNEFWLWTGVRTLSIAALTVLVISIV